MSNRPNILLITADQWRGDCLGTVGHPVVRTPNLDAFAENATVFEQHYAATAPCSPSRASLYTGLYQMNHRVVRNGAPLDDRFDNIARAARRAGYTPTLFGYTDTSPDPRQHDPNDPALKTYEGVLPGFAVRQSLHEDDKPWLSWLTTRGYDPAEFDKIHQVEQEEDERVSLAPPRYSHDETQTAFLTNTFLTWLEEQQGEDRPWMAHVSFLRPHPPIAVPAPYNTMYDPEEGPDFAGAESAEKEASAHPVIAALQDVQRLASHIPGASGLVRDLARRDLARIRALYYGMITEVDAQLGRIFSVLDSLENTMIIFTSDHAEMMGDHWMLGKGGYYKESYHIPLVIRSPYATKGNRVTSFTSSTDVFPTLLDVLEIDPEHAPDGRSLAPFLVGMTPTVWRDAALWEFDCRELMKRCPHHFPDTSSHTPPALLVRRGADWQYVHVTGLPGILLKDAGATDIEDYSDQCQDIVCANIEALLTTRLRHNDETLARTLVWDYYGQ